jgi:hypothetical protein
MNAQTATRTRFSIPALIAIVAALASFAVGAFWGFVLAIVAVAFGIVGLLLAFSSRVRGGFLSAIAIIGGLLGVIAAVVKGVAWVL